MSFRISFEELNELNELRDAAMLKEKGGVEGIVSALSSDGRQGLSVEEEVQDFDLRVKEFGKNVYPQKPPKNLFVLFFNALKEPILIVLIVLAIVSIVLGVTFPEREADRPLGWIEGFAIIMAVLIVSSVTSINDWSKDRQFRALNAASAEINIKVIRGGQNKDVLISKLVVGDIVNLDTGDQVPADGIIVESFDLKIDESVMTGETDLIRKNSENPFLLSGCQVAEGCGKMLVTAVGINSEWGKTLKRLSEDDDEKTPLAQKLDKLAELIGQVGVLFSVLTFIALLFVWLVQKLLKVTDGQEEFGWHNLGEVVKFVVIAVTIVVVAVPEGLPLAVTISLAYSVKKMMKDNNLVRHLQACETMGGATNICSDKTGTLTLNQMRVVKGWFSGAQFMDSLPGANELNQHAKDLLIEGISANSKANLIEHEDKSKEFAVQGNKTEGALLILVQKNLNTPYLNVRSVLEEKKAIEKIFTFSSAKKRMSCIVRVKESPSPVYRIYTKGASEIVLGLCNYYINDKGQTQQITPEYKKQLDEIIIAMADQGLRTLCLAYKDVTNKPEDGWTMEQEELENDMICYAIVGIKDPLRPEVVDAVKACKKAGIFVRMVTGDNIRTAKHIARECGILDDRGMAMEGPVFRKLSVAELDAQLPKLQVLARSSPDDKFNLVKRLRALDEVVAVTGDGTNDAPALKEADVGLSMGLSGTQVAKEASDIVILDDNFKSIVKSVLWGRSVFENIRKFLQFQLTVNVVALLLTVTTALTTFIPPEDLLPKGIDKTKLHVTHLEPPLTAVQLLWVNLIMDTFAALALATEPPHESLLDRKPYGRFESLVTPNMWINLISQGLYQMACLLFIYYGGITVGFTNKNYELAFEQNNTLVFNTFVFCQIFNQFNSRKINNELNIFHNIHKSFMFMIIIVVTIACQTLIIFFGGRVTQTTPLDWKQWLVSVGFGVASIPISVLVRIIMKIVWAIVNKIKSLRKKDDDDDELAYHEKK